MKRELLKEIISYILLMIIVLLVCVSGIVRVPGITKEDEHIPMQYETEIF
jgi:hypothetical protein